MSRYNNFYDEQPFQQTNFRVDSPGRGNSRGYESNRVELPKKAFGSAGKNLNVYFEKEKEHDHRKDKPEHHMDIEKAMHHEEVGLLRRTLIRKGNLKVFFFSSDFDEYKIPPDWELAANHAVRNFSVYGIFERGVEIEDCAKGKGSPQC